MLKRRKLLVAIALLSLGLVACGQKDPDGLKQEIKEGQEPLVQDLVEGIEGHMLAEEIVYDKFIEDHGPAGFKLKKMNYKAHRNIYELEAVNQEGQELELKIDAGSGETLGQSIERSEGLGGEILKQDLINIPSLIEKSLEDAGQDYSFKEWSLELDDGIKEFTVELEDGLGRDRDYKYDISTSRLLERDD